MITCPRLSVNVRHGVALSARKMPADDLWEPAVGWVEKRESQAGRVRYTAMFRDLTGHKRSAGTFGTQRTAARAWQKAEVDLAAGRIADRRPGTQTLQRYVQEQWLPNHVIEATTRESYTYLLTRYILPELGSRRMAEILPGHVREWVTRMQQVLGARPPTIRKCKVILDSIFTTALTDQITVLHAGKGVKTPTVATKPRAIVSAAQFEEILSGVEHEAMRLLVETDIETGLRWGELTELRPKDVDLDSGVIIVCRVVVHLRSAARDDQARFVVKEYPKDKQWRRVTISASMAGKLRCHIEQEGLGPNDLLFQQPTVVALPTRSRAREDIEPSTLGFTTPTASGHRYQHGTTTAYGNGRCRCQHCKDAIASYRASRRASGKDTPRAPRTVRTDGHISGDWFRKAVWAGALAKADLGFHVTPHGLRHAHASWILAGGADLQVVKERLGHGSIRTTEMYLRALPDSRDTALQALADLRGPDAIGRSERISSIADAPDLTPVLEAIERLKVSYKRVQNRQA